MTSPDADLPGSPQDLKRFWCEHAWLGRRGQDQGAHRGRRRRRISSVTCGVEAPPADAEKLAGLTVPGLANVHSHAFHRALRGRTQVELRHVLDLARAACTRPPRTWTRTPTGRWPRAVFAEMALAGVTAVGEFHYLHHSPKGGAVSATRTRWATRWPRPPRPPASGITLLDTCYLAGGFDTELNDAQRRFSDGDAGRWAERVEALRKAYAGSRRCGSARRCTACARSRWTSCRRWWPSRREHELPLHVHLSEQRAENDACLARHHKTPTRAAARTTAPSGRAPRPCTPRTCRRWTSTCSAPPPRRSACAPPPSATSPTASARPTRSTWPAPRSTSARDSPRRDRPLRGGARGGARRAPAHRTPRPLARRGAAAGGDRRRPRRRSAGRRAGRLEVGALADFTTIALDTVRLAGVQPAHAAESVIFAATAADVRHVVVGGPVHGARSSARAGGGRAGAAGGGDRGDLQVRGSCSGRRY